MRFLANGPSIPDDLLVARDAGDVIFFCGAGVSRHRAGLPDFIKLAGEVIKQLGAGEKSLAYKLLNRIQEMRPMDGVGGLVSIDRIFSLLERLFERKELRAAVARSIRPAANADLSAHRTLIDLSRGRDGNVRLVTTNFDLLFEACIDGIPCAGPPVLPDPRSPNFGGIVHLHGRVDPSYAGPADEEFILSSADFGRAYLSDSWATHFIQSLLARFQIVFVGYAADDPPVQYLLEALNLNAGNRSRLFAFLPGSNVDDTALWEHRGVSAIPFDSSLGFDSLWDSLAAWAERARDVDGWYVNLLATAAAGPAAVDPHIRGQIAHVLSTREGTRRVSVAAVPLPASWLLALDPRLRYEKPGWIEPYDKSSERIDPYQSLALDFDTPPQPIDEDTFNKTRATPDGSWDVFAPTRSDQAEVQDHGLGDFCGDRAAMSGALSKRLSHFAIWFHRIAHQPIALWWAAGRGPLHTQTVEMIEVGLRHDPDRWSDELRRGWRLLIAAWSDRRGSPDQLYHDLSRCVMQEGWAESLVRNYAALFQPKLRVERRFGLRHPLTWTDTSPPSSLLCYNVDYPHPYKELVVPDRLLSYTVSRFRENLDLARSLEAEISDGQRAYMETTRAGDGDPPIPYDSYGLTGPIAQLQSLMERLVEVARDLARAELARWPVVDDHIFARLRIWASSSAITAPSEAAEILLGFPDEVFWGSQHQRDLLYAIRDRWRDFSAKERVHFEKRLRTSSFPWQNDPPKGKVRVAAHRRLDRLHWLTSQGVTFSFDVTREMAALRSIATDWSERTGQEAANSHAPKVQSIMSDVSPRMLDDLPISEILDQARQASEADLFNSFERRPFSGLAMEKPSRALAALSNAARKGRCTGSLLVGVSPCRQTRDRPHPTSPRHNRPARIIAAGCAERHCLPSRRVATGVGRPLVQRTGAGARLAVAAAH
jgi:hypothetical protein